MPRMSPCLRSATRQVFAFSFCLLLIAFIRRVPVQTSAPDNRIAEPNYVDLRAGWRLRVVIPIQRSGGYIVPTAALPQGDTISVSAGGDFIGYETDYYDVRSHHGSEMRIAFNRAEAVERGNTSNRTQPTLQLFSLPPHVKFADGSGDRQCLRDLQIISRGNVHLDSCRSRGCTGEENAV
jgi:hypothetical protein